MSGKITLPMIPVDHPEFKWKNGSDVQATWRRFGWTPPSEKMTPPPPEKVAEPLAAELAARRYWRIK